MSFNYWQVAAGSYGRDYTDSFLRFGMAFVGGPKNVTKMKKVKRGDRMILCRGVSDIIAVGEVIEKNGTVGGHLDKPWLRDFDGWDLSAYCYVDWHLLASKTVSAGTLARQTTIGPISHVKIHQQAENILQSTPPNTKTEQEPGETKRVEADEILGFLVEEGMRPAAAEEFVATFRRIRLLANYYREKCRWEDVREHETRTFLIVPLLIALGWSEQQLKVELSVNMGAASQNRGRVDIACFSRPYKWNDHAKKHNNQDCVLILESKGFAEGLTYAPTQAQGYATAFPNCNVVVASNGYCYKVFCRNASGRFGQEPSAYVNLLSPQDKYPLDPENVKGCLEAFRLLLPSSY